MTARQHFPTYKTSLCRAFINAAALTFNIILGGTFIYLAFSLEFHNEYSDILLFGLNINIQPIKISFAIALIFCGIASFITEWKLRCWVIKNYIFKNNKNLTPLRATVADIKQILWIPVHIKLIDNEHNEHYPLIDTFSFLQWNKGGEYIFYLLHYPDPDNKKSFDTVILFSREDI